jgi:hypothetical protein
MALFSVDKNRVALFHILKEYPQQGLVTKSVFVRSIHAERQFHFAEIYPSPRRWAVNTKVEMLLKYR